MTIPIDLAERLDHIRAKRQKNETRPQVVAALCDHYEARRGSR